MHGLTRNSVVLFAGAASAARPFWDSRTPQLVKSRRSVRVMRLLDESEKDILGQKEASDVKIYCQATINPDPDLAGGRVHCLRDYELYARQPGQAMLGQGATQEDINALNHELGYDRPFIVKFGDYVYRLCRGDMGTSYITKSPVLTELTSRLPTTLTLTTVALLISIFIGIPIGIISAVKQYGALDIAGTVTAMFMAAIPGFWMGLMLILLFSLKLGWLPSVGIKSWVSFILPSITLALPSIAGIMRLTRTTMLETIRQDYVRTARSKGQMEFKVVVRHALKNALLPVVTSTGLAFGMGLGGAIVTEQVFSINGVGTLIITSILSKDIPLVLGCAIALAFFFTVIMLLVDIVYALVDPRIKARYQRRKA